MKADITKIDNYVSNGKDYVILELRTERIPKESFQHIFETLFQGQVNIVFE